MPDTLATYIDRLLANGASGGLRNPLMKMPVKRFRRLTKEELADVESGHVWHAGTMADPVARNLWKNYDEKIRERGEHTAFVTLGSVEVILAGTAMGGGNRTALMPVWIKRVQLKKSNDRVSVQAQEEPVWDLNPELEHALSQLGIDVSHGPKGTPGALVKWIASQAGNRATVDPSATYLGCFSSQHLIIRERIKDSRWRRAVAQNDAVRAKLSGDPSGHGLDVDRPVSDDDIEELGLVLPVDDSQLRVVQAANHGRSLVVQGPPGTGKSQTIANLIANAWWNGKRVLLVCDKRTAIRQVEERLQKCGLGAALLNLHDEGLDKRDFLQQAVDRFGSRTGAASKYPFLELAQLRSSLNERVLAGEQVAHGSIGVKRREALHGMISLRNKLGSIPTVDIPNWRSLSRERLGRLLNSASEWEPLANVVGESDNVWNDVVAEAFRMDPNARNEVLAVLAGLGEALASISLLAERATGVGFLSDFEAQSDLDSLATLSQLIADRPSQWAEALADNDLSVQHLDELLEILEQRNTLLKDAHPIDLATILSDSDHLRAKELLSREGVDRWQDLQKKALEYRAEQEALNAADEKYLHTSTNVGMTVLDNLFERRGQVTMVTELAQMAVAVPEDWWDVRTVSPAATLLRWESEMRSISAHIRDAIYPTDLQALRRVSHAAWQDISAKAEDGFNVISYCVRYVNDRRAKAALSQVYPSIPRKGDAPWFELVLHALKARDIVQQAVATAELHPELRELTARYLADSRSAPDVTELLASPKVTVLREAARHVEIVRQRTDFFSVEGPVWRTWWNSPGRQKAHFVEECGQALFALNLPDQANDSITHNKGWLRERVTSLDDFVRHYCMGGGEMSHGVTASFAAQSVYAKHEQRLIELERYKAWGRIGNRECDWSHIRGVMVWREAFIESRGQHKVDVDNLGWQALGQSVKALSSTLQTSLRKLSRYFKGATGWGAIYASLAARLAQVEGGLPHSDMWLQKAEWNARIHVLPELAPFWTRVKDGDMNAADARLLFCYNILRLSAPPVEPNGAELAGMLRTFAKQDGEMESWSVEALRDKIGTRQRDAAARYPQTHGELKRLAGLQRIRGTIRQICDAHLQFLLDVKPGWLVSPISLANLIDLQRLPEDGPMFDLVIFDEASQVQVIEGLLAMAFARQTIVVGDDKQLPPTSFFTSMPTLDDDPTDLGDSESLIEEFSGVVPSTMLMAHYRSETPDLIAFSNRQFYEGKLEMFPPARVAGTGRLLRQVPDGVFDSGATRTNKAEAKVVVRLVAEHVAQWPKASLGVIAMNVEQMELIEQMIFEEPLIAPEFRADEDRFFIRNLETVQGDEMDRIIISLTYGKNQEGKFNASVLGPFTKRGGHRRLNVALSRSRSGMTIVSSVTAAELAKSSAQSRGFLCLKELLEELEQSQGDRRYGVSDRSFSKRTDAASELVHCESPFEEQVVEFLENEGYEVLCQVGAGGFRIDIVVINNGLPLLAVECDGAAYHSSHSARTRDRARQRQLEKLGWRFHRVWSTNWWVSPDAEKQALVEAISSALRDVSLQRSGPAFGASTSIGGTAS